MKGNGFTADTLAPLVDMSAATLYRRTSEKGSAKGKHWLALEVANIAAVFKLEVDDLYQGRARFGPPEGPDDDGGAAAPDSRQRLQNLADRKGRGPNDDQPSARYAA